MIVLCYVVLYDFVHCLLLRRNDKYIRKKEKEGIKHFSDSLSDALLHKDMNSFWKSWRSKMGGGSTSDIIDEYRHPRDIAEICRYL